MCEIRGQMKDLIDHQILEDNPPMSELVSLLVKKEADPSIYTEWMLLFDWYNSDPANPHKSMGCRPCYGVVWSWYKKKMYKEKFREDYG